MRPWIKRCQWCGTMPCPYADDESYRAKTEKEPNWKYEKECWTPIEERDFSAEALSLGFVYED